MAKSENKRRTKGEGSLEFNEKKKKWVARITAHRADGSSFRKTFEGKTQKEAKSKRDEWLRHHKEESERIRSNEAFGKYVNEWIRTVLSLNLLVARQLQARKLTLQESRL